MGWLTPRFGLGVGFGELRDGWLDPLDEVFIGEGRAFNSSLYFTGGLGSTAFGGDDRFTINFGAGVRFLLTDSIALHLDFRDHLFDTDLLGEEKTVHNLESHLGLTVFF